MKVRIMEFTYQRHEGKDDGLIEHSAVVVTRPSTPAEIAADKKDADPNADNDARIKVTQVIQQVLAHAVSEWSKQNEIPIDDEALQFAANVYVERVRAKATVHPDEQA